MKQKLDIKEKEINELKTILNTNASMKSQISSIYQDQKEDENSKEKEKEICSYTDNNNNYFFNNLKIKKKKHKSKSLSLIERKLSHYSSINRRNLLRMNYINRSINSKNNSRRINSSKKNKNKNIKGINNSKMGDLINPKSEYKYKTIANIYNSGSTTKHTKNDNSIKIKQKIKKSSYYNYNSINSLRLKKLDKSISRSMPSKRGIEESFYKNYFLNINRSDISLNKNKQLNKNNMVKNKILINYNTNIINTNISIDKSSIHKKMKDFRNSLEEKLTDVTRNKNKKNSIKRTISAFYDKRDKSSFFIEKLKTRRESSFRHNNFYNIDKNNSLKIKKNKYNFGNGFFNNNNEYNSNFFRKKFPQLTIPHKNKNGKKSRKMKIKLKDNSMFNIKKDISREFSKNKLFKIQAYTGKNPKEENKNNKIIKNVSMININKNIISIKKHPNYETNVNRTLKSNPYNVGLTYRKHKNLEKMSFLYDKNLSKNENKIKINKLNINSSTNRINPSLKKFIFSKCISNTNIS